MIGKCLKVGRLENLLVSFSNRIEVLYEDFKKYLFGSSHPLSKRLVIVPSAAMKSWLRLQLAKDPEIGIAAGIEIGFVEPSINRLCRLVGRDIREGFEPSELELALTLEKAIEKVVQNFVHMTQDRRQVWIPLMESLQISLKKTVLNKRSAKRVCVLAASLAKIFLDYGRYGPRVIAEDAQDWQGQLWMTMEEHFSPWNYPYRKLESVEVNGQCDPEDLQMHVFGLSYLAPLHHRFFTKIAKTLPVHYYLLSPCEKFWSDTLSNRESAKLQRYWKQKEASLAQQETLEAFLFDHNPLLANFGRLGREMALQIESSDLITEETYSLPASIFTHEAYEDLISDEVIKEHYQKKLTLLDAVQADIALLRNPNNDLKLVFDRYDETIQVHAAPKPMRETQVIYDAIMRIIERHQHDDVPITPSDVVVMSPNVSEYAPWVQAVFGSSESVLDYQLMDLQMPSWNPFIKSFLHLLSLPFGRWDALSLLRLFEFPAFQAKHQLTMEDVSLVRRWIKETGIFWGSDSHHRNDVMTRNHGNEIKVDSWNGTWEDGFGKLLEGLAGLSNQDQHFSSRHAVETTQGELLGKVLHLLRALFADLKPLSENAVLSLKEWSAYLKCFCEAYLQPGHDEEAVEGSRLLLQHIQAFGTMQHMEETGFAFHTIYYHLEKGLQTQVVKHRESHVQAVRFCSLLPMRSMPAKVIVLLGMHDGAFPRADQSVSFNHLINHPKADYFPSQMDFDRYLFLEALLSARKYFVISYLSQDAKDAKEQSPSLLVSELLSYFDKAYVFADGSLSKQRVFQHSLIPFDQRYFKDDAFRTYFKSYYAAAQVHYLSEKTMSPHFIDRFDTEKNAIVIETLIDLADLMTFAKNPLKTYLNKTLGIYLERESDRFIKTEEDLHISALDASILSKNGFLKGQNWNEKSGKLPQGPFKPLSIKQVTRNVDEYRNNLRSMGVTVDQIFTIEISDRFQSPSLTGSQWQIPALHIGNVSIIGKMEHLSPKGLVLFEGDQMNEAVKAWPLILVFCCLVKKYQLPVALQVIFAEGNQPKIKEALFENPEIMLQNYLDYYFKARSNPSPLIPDSISKLMIGSTDGLKKVFRTSDDEAYVNFFEEYLKWIERNSPEIPLDTALHWQDTAKVLFGDLAAVWYPSKKAAKGGNDELI